MINIKETLKKPSVALQMMMDGLIEQSKREDFEIDMHDFGRSDGTKMCYGCAATCAIQKIAGKNLTVGNIAYSTDRAKYLGFRHNELRIFEDAIDQARKGDLYTLFEFFYSSDYLDDINIYQDRIYLRNAEDWEDKIPEIKRLIADLQKSGY